MMLNLNKKVLYEKSRSKIDFIETGCSVIAYLFPEAARHRCSYEKVFWKYATNLQENTQTEVWFAAYF